MEFTCIGEIKSFFNDENAAVVYIRMLAYYVTS